MARVIGTYVEAAETLTVTWKRAATTSWSRGCARAEWGTQVGVVVHSSGAREPSDSATTTASSPLASRKSCGGLT